MNTVTARVGKPKNNTKTAIEGIEKQLVPFFTARLIGVREADIENALRVNWSLPDRLRLARSVRVSGATLRFEIVRSFITPEMGRTL